MADVDYGLGMNQSASVSSPSVDMPGAPVPAAAYCMLPGEEAAGFPLGGMGVAWVERSPHGAFQFRCPPSPADEDSSGSIPPVTIPGCQFAIFEQAPGERAQAYALGTQPPTDHSLNQWQWYPVDPARSTTQVHHLYPRTWYSYGGVFHSQMVCEQFSPILAANYQETSYPLGVFEWRFYNPSDRPLTVSVMLSWENLLGATANHCSGEPSLSFNPSGGNFNRWVEDFFRVGCTLMNTSALGEEGYLTTKDAPPSNQGQWAIVTVENPAVEVFYHTRWRPDGDGGDLWDSFATDGSLPNENGERATLPGERIGAAIAVRFTMRPGRSRTIPFMVCWDLPTSAVTTAALGQVPYRATDFFGRDGQNAWYMGRTALKHYDTWRTAIEQWQQAQLKQWPPTVQTMCLNSLARLVRESAPWTAADEWHPRGQLGNGENSVCTLENTWALHRLWPSLDHSQIRSGLARLALSIADTSPEQRPRAIAQGLDLVLRLYREHRCAPEPDWQELADMWPWVVQCLDPVAKGDFDAIKPGGPMERSPAEGLLLELGLEAAIRLGQALIDHREIAQRNGGPTDELLPDLPLEAGSLTALLDTYKTAQQRISRHLTEQWIDGCTGRDNDPDGLQGLREATLAQALALPVTLGLDHWISLDWGEVIAHSPQHKRLLIHALIQLTAAHPEVDHLREQCQAALASLPPSEAALSLWEIGDPP